ncbi:MAG TPA: cation:dicarboxylase symporter family transporter, partial [Vicinamibacterales bacterium]|nr:cation:dicarboxylase symporter family transporter [Vicinamibacterales bacterium]
MSTQSLFERIASGNLVAQIGIGIVAGIALLFIWPEGAARAMLFGDLFVQALKAVAPVLVLVLVAAALANQQHQHPTRIRPIIVLYLVGTFSAAVLAVLMSLAFPSTLTLQLAELDVVPPQGIVEVLKNLLFKLVDNPVNALITGNYIGILVWGVALGLGLRHASQASREMLTDVASAVTSIVRIVIRLAPIG